MLSAKPPPPILRGWSQAILTGRRGVTLGIMSGMVCASAAPEVKNWFIVTNWRQPMTDWTCAGRAVGATDPVIG